MSNFVKYSGVKCKRSSSVFSFEVSKGESQSLHLTNSEVFFACVLLVLSQFDRTQGCFDGIVNDKLQFASILIKIIVQLQNAWPLLNIHQTSRLVCRLGIGKIYMALSVEFIYLAVRLARSIGSG